MFKQLVLLLTILYYIQAKSVTIGQVDELNGVRKVYEILVEKTGIPLLKRKEEVYFEYPEKDKLIKGIAIKDLKNGDAVPSIVRGGVGFNHVNIKLKSTRGSGFKFWIEFYM